MKTPFFDILEAAITAWNTRASDESQDAQRYRWLRAGNHILEINHREERRLRHYFPSGEKLDKAIDAAMQTEAE